MKDGKIASVSITDAGAGYTVPPEVAVDSISDAHLTVTLLFCSDLKTNGSIKSVLIVANTTATPSSTMP